MSDDLEGFAEWQGTIESRVTTLEVTVKTEARVRAQMDKDISDMSAKLDAHGRLLQALHETQTDHTARLSRLEAGMERLEGRTERLEARSERLEAGQAKVLAGVQAIIGLLDREIGDLPE